MPELRATIIYGEDSPCGHEIICPDSEKYTCFCPVCWEFFKREKEA